MEFSIFFRVFLLCAVTSSSALAGSEALGYRLDVYSESACVIDDDGVHCWGDYLSKRMPTFSNPRQVSTGLYNACVLDDDGVKCWGNEVYGVTAVPTLKNTKEVSVGDTTACAIDEIGISCWGNNWDKKTTWPVKDAHSLSVGDDYACAIIESAVECWAENSSKSPQSYFDEDRGQYRDALIPPPLVNPRKVSVSRKACALDDTGVVCWGQISGIDLKTEFPVFKNPKDISVGHGVFCVVDEEGVKCWGNREVLTTTLPTMKNPYQASAGFNGGCALDDEGVKCWNYKYSTEKLTKLMPALSFYRVFDFKEYLTPIRATYFAPFRKLEQDAARNSEDRHDFLTIAYFLNALQAPNILSVDSARFQETLIPTWQSRMSKWASYLGYADLEDGLHKAPDTDFLRKAALTSIQSALSVGENFLAPIEQERVQAAVRLAGVAIAEPNNDQKITRLLNAIENLSLEKEKLSKSNRTHFLVRSLDLACDWLKAKVEQ